MSGRDGGAFVPGTVGSDFVRALGPDGRADPGKRDEEVGAGTTGGGTLTETGFEGGGSVVADAAAIPRSVE